MATPNPNKCRRCESINTFRTKLDTYISNNTDYDYNKYSGSNSDDISINEIDSISSSYDSYSDGGGGKNKTENILTYKEGIVLRLDDLVDLYSSADTDSQSSSDSQNRPETVTILMQDYAMGGETIGIDIGLYISGSDSKICIVKTLGFHNSNKNSASIDSNEINIAKKLMTIQHDDRLCFSTPILCYDRSKAYDRSAVSSKISTNANTDHPDKIQTYQKKIEYMSLLYNYINGHNLGEIIKSHPDILTHYTKTRIIKTVWHAIKTLHRNRIIHSDIKPSNIMIEDSISTGTNKLCKISVIDFGKSSYFPLHMDAIDFLAERRNAIKRAFSTVQYVSATVFIDPDFNSTTDPDVFYHMLMLNDIWSFGMLIYEMVVGKVYYDYKGPAVSVISRMIRDMGRYVRPETPIPLTETDMSKFDTDVLVILNHCCTYRPRRLSISDADFVEYAKQEIQMLDEMVSCICSHDP